MSSPSPASSLPLTPAPLLHLIKSSAPMDIPLGRTNNKMKEVASSSSCSASSSSFHSPQCSCSPSCSFHPPFEELASSPPGAPASPLDDVSIDEVLPVELLQHVMGYLPLHHLACDVAGTSRLWRNLALDPALWLPHWRSLHYARPSVELVESDVQRGVQPPPEGAWGDERGSASDSDPWLIDAGRSLRQAYDEDFPIDWRREYLRRKKLSVLIVTYHTSHTNHYDVDTTRQLRKFGIDADICHLMCNHDSVNRKADGTYRFVEYDDNLFMKYDTIIYFAAMSGSESLRKSLGDSLMAYLRSGGGVIFCIYTHMKSYQLLGQWTESFYPMKTGQRSLKGGEEDDEKRRDAKPHAVMRGVRRTQIDPTRNGSRFHGYVDPQAQILGEYEDGTPLVVVLDGDANRAKAREEKEEEAKQKDEGAHAEEKKKEQKKEKAEEEEEEPWGKTVFLNVFPVTKDDPCTGGWYDWNSDMPLLLRNAVLFAARKGKAPSSSV